jgi:PAS domain S-box-containing protein
MNRLERSPLHGSVVALGLTAVALLVSLVLRPYLEPDIFLLFVVAVWLSSWYYGRLIGLLATGAGAFALLFFFIDGVTPPWAVVARLGAFLITATLIAWVTAAWRNSRQLLASTLASIGDAVMASDREGRISFLNAAAEALTGWNASTARHRPADEVLRLVSEGTREPVANPFLRAIQERAPVTGEGPTLLTARTGSEVPVEYSTAPVRGVSGRIAGAILVLRDISKRRQLEEQAVHAQKMEAVGRLAGGVAGDFNNMLTVISGYADLLRADIPTSTPSRKFVDEIAFAGERAAALTRHLLAFSRGASTQPRPLDLNSLLAAMEPMLRRLLGQNIELMVLKGPSLGRVQADPSQLEQVVVNLATNSREAMPAGGKLVIETANVDIGEAATTQPEAQPGPYVMLAVSDTGIGMDAATRSRLFEPFFTTKAPGSGSGLGLSTVYGAVKQADGWITVYSQPNCGTIIEVYFPRVTSPAPQPVRRPSAKGSETILLVDDEEGVRTLCAAILQANGYTVLPAAGGAAAVAVFDKNAHKVDLLLTDVVLPQMNGFELGARLMGSSARLKVLYMSGYRETALGAAPPGPPIAFLEKPFTPDALLAKVRDVLDAAPVA